MAKEVNDKADKINSEDREDDLGHKPRIKPIIEAADGLSLGISMVVAVLMGVGIGWLLKSLTEVSWTFWIGVGIGIAAAILNVYKAYAKEYKAYEELAKEPRYAIKKQLDDDEDDDEYSQKNY
ncbi:MAG: AtpZ/AtpI family protein [Sulfurimonas sp.]|nr:AtpZ/AtpI family protein [Sulfurimonas sp.]